MKEKLLYVGLGMGSIIFIQIVVGSTLIFMYKKGFFNSESLVSSGTTLTNYYSLDDSSLNDSGNFLGELKLDRKIVKDTTHPGIYRLYFEEKRKDESYIDLDKNIIDFVTFSKYFSGNQEIISYGSAFLGMHGYIFDVNLLSHYLSTIDSFDIDVKSYRNFHKKTIGELGSFLNSADKAHISDWYAKLLSSYNDVLKLNKGKTISTCYYYFCSEYPEMYTYVKNAILNDKKLYSDLTGLESKYGVDLKYFYGIIMIENLRMHTTFKGNFKQMLVGLRVPALPVMNQFSYGLYGMKLNALTKMVNEYTNKYSIFYIGENQLLENIKASYYYVDSNSNYTLDASKEQNLIDYIVKDKAVQSELIAIYLSGQLKAWNKIGIDLNKKPGILFTLYNIGSFKQPHLNPELGGAPINLVKKNYSFGELGERFFYSLELDNILNQMEKSTKSKE